MYPSLVPMEVRNWTASGTAVTDGDEPTCGCWESKSSKKRALHCWTRVMDFCCSTPDLLRRLLQMLGVTRKFLMIPGRPPWWAPHWIACKAIYGSFHTSGAAVLSQGWRSPVQRQFVLLHLGIYEEMLLCQGGTMWGQLHTTKDVSSHTSALPRMSPRLKNTEYF